MKDPVLLSKLKSCCWRYRPLKMFGSKNFFVNVSFVLELRTSMYLGLELLALHAKLKKKVELFSQWLFTNHLFINLWLLAFSSVTRRLQR